VRMCRKIALQEIALQIDAGGVAHTATAVSSGSSVRSGTAAVAAVAV
jgi:hypothetical protein